MAEMQVAATSRSTRPRAKKHAFRLDMTPMVDLAFLLLTFFMLTTSFAKPVAMQLTMPDKGGKTDIVASKSLTLILGKNSQVHYFLGLNSAQEPAEVSTTNFSPNGLRQVLLAQRQRQPGTTVLIKASADSKYHDLVDALDEMAITDQRKYALVDLDPADAELLQRQGL